jgi:hypothetical protein
MHTRALALAALLCAFAGAAHAADDRAQSCLDGVSKACRDVGIAVADNEPAVGDIDALDAACDKTHDEKTCAGLLRERIKAGCRAGNQASCRTLGESEARRLAGETAPTTETLEASCKRKDPQACTDLASRLLEDEPSKANQQRAMALFDRACKGRVGDACAKLGLMYAFKGNKADGRRGEKLLKRACDLGSQAGCNFLPPQPKLFKPGDRLPGPGLLQTDDVRQTMKNLVRLSKLLRQNCNLGYADACAELRDPDDSDDPTKKKLLSPAELATRIRQLERQAAAGPAPTKK